MKRSIPITLVMMGALLGGGCATKNMSARQSIPSAGNSIRWLNKPINRGRKSIRLVKASTRLARILKKTKQS